MLKFKSRTQTKKLEVSDRQIEHLRKLALSNPKKFDKELLKLIKGKKPDALSSLFCYPFFEGKVPQEVTEKVYLECTPLLDKYGKRMDTWVSNCETTMGAFKQDQHNSILQLEGTEYTKSIVSSICKAIADYLRVDATKLMCFDCWLNRYSTLGQFQESHSHTGETISVIYYLKADEDASSVCFYNPAFLSMNAPTYHEQPFVSLKPYTGAIYAFPSYIMHSVTPHMGNSDRVSMSFNLFYSP